MTPGWSLFLKFAMVCHFNLLILGFFKIYILGSKIYCIAISVIIIIIERTRKGRPNRKRHKKSPSAVSSKSNAMSDFTLLYKADFLKQTCNVFATQKELENRLRPFIAKWQTTFAFQCCSCQYLYQNAEELSNHNSRWCQMQVTCN